MAFLQMNFLSRCLGLQTNVNVIIPSFSVDDAVHQNYHPYREGMKYQVLYLLHGGSGDYQDYIKFSNIIRYAEKHKLVVIMPSGYNSRYSDFIGGPRVLEYLTVELPEFCNATFPISTKREDTFIAGLSMGGNGAMKIASLYPERFSTVLCMSGAPFDPDTIKEVRGPVGTGENQEAMPGPNVNSIWGNLDEFKGSRNDAWHYAKLNVEKKKKLPVLYFACGGKDVSKPVVDEAYQYMTNLGYQTTYLVEEEYGHEWDFWDKILRKAMDDGWFPLKNEAIYG